MEARWLSDRAGKVTVMKKKHGGKTRKIIKNNVPQHVPASYFNFDKFQLPGKLLAWETESRKAF